MSKKKHLEDCYFFFYGTCVKNEECEYRHALEALGTETICKQWMKGRCNLISCPFRHMKPTKVKRSHIPCHYENKPSGCRKPHCMFWHKTERAYILEDFKTFPKSLILPLEVKPISGKNEDDDILLLTKQFVSINVKNSTPVVSSTPDNDALMPNGQSKVVDFLKSTTSKNQQNNVTANTSQGSLTSQNQKNNVMANTSQGSVNQVQFATGSPLQHLQVREAKSRFHYVSPVYKFGIAPPKK